MRITKWNRMTVALIGALAFVAPRAFAQDAVARPARAVVVYPAVMTTAQDAPNAAIREPVVEAREFDIETPIGQVRAIAKTLDELRAGQAREMQALDATLRALEIERQHMVEALDALAKLDAKLDANVASEEAPERAAANVEPAPLADSTTDRYEPFLALARMAAVVAALWLALRGVESCIREARARKNR